MIKKYVLATNPSQLWFLWMLFGVFAMVWPLRKVIIEKPELVGVLSLGFYATGVSGKALFQNIFCIWDMFQYAPFFFIGMRIRVKAEEKRVASVPCFVWIIADLTVFIVVGLCEQKSGIVWSFLNICLSFVLHIIGALMAWNVLHKLALRINWNDNRAFKNFSSYSMPMYLFHQQIIYFTIYFLNGKINPWLNAMVNFAVAIVGTFMISAILMRYNITRFLIGEK